MTKKIPEKWQAHWITPAEVLKSHPILRRDFACGKPPKQAQLYISGLGLFEVYLNGEKLGDEVLTPFFDNYNIQTQVLAFDVTEKLQQENRLEILLGDGWYKGRFGMIPTTNRYGSELCAIAQLEVSGQDGQTQLICTDESWDCLESPILSSGIYDGERQDYTLQVDRTYPVQLCSRTTKTLVPRCSAPLRVTERLQVQQVLLTPKGETVLDFGQNFAGWVEIKCSQPAGTEIHLDFGEVLVDGNFYNENYRSAAGGFSVVCSGDKRQYRPHFTYFGFRYVRVTGWTGTITGREFTGCVIHSDLPRTGWFHCGHEGVNRLYQNILWSQRSNFVDVPTDCPQRDERLPWSGDAQIFAPTACYNMDCRRFYPHYLELMRLDQQCHNGGISSYLPWDPVLNDPCSIWGDAAIEIPMTLYDRYGDRAILEQCFPMMVDWSEYLYRQDQEHGGHWLLNYGFQFGDWLALDGVSESSFKGETEDGLVATFYWYHSMEQMARAAQILGKERARGRYSRMAQCIRKAAMKEYFSPNGRLAVDTQTGYLLSLRFGLYSNRERMIEGLMNRLQKDCWQISSGFAAAPLLCPVLADNGMEQVALRMLLNEQYPGWLYEVGQGATTIWERWNSLLPDGTVNPSGMNSFNHYSYGSIGQFLYERVAGLKNTAPGFTSVHFAPCVDGRLGHCEAAYDSVAGRWESKWCILPDGSLEVSLLVPEGCTATIELPFSGQEPFRVKSGLFEQTYRPQRDLLAKYSGDTLLQELSADPAAMGIVASKAPQLTGIIASGDKELGATPLSQLMFMPQLGLASDVVARLIDELGKLKFDCNDKTERINTVAYWEK